MTEPHRRHRIHRPRWLTMPTVVYAHPFELAIGLVGVINGLRTTLTRETTPTIAQLPPVAIIALTMCGLIGGAAMLLGLMSRAKTLGRTVERMGLLLSAGSYFGYSIVLYFYAPLAAAWASIVLSATIGLACFLRERAVRKTELTILRTLRTANRSEDVIRGLVDTHHNDSKGDE